MPQYDTFNIEPGMASWVDMPNGYKKAYFERQKPKKKKAKTSINVMGSSVSNFIDNKFFDERRKKLPVVFNSEKRPKILLISDVSGWAWWNKSKYLQMYLADEFDIDVICLVGHDASGINSKKYDLYFTYGYSYVVYISHIPIKKRATGLTAHRPRQVLEPQMKMAHYVHANSKLLLKELREMVNHDRVYYVPNGVDEELFKCIEPIGEREKLVAGHVGKQCAEKKQEEIIIPAIDKAEVESFYNLNDYTNRMPYCEMYKQYQEMDVFVVCSIEDGTPNGALEAAACGRPIISNRIGNMPEFIKDGYNGFLVDMNIDSYVEKLNFFNENRDKLKQMGQNARKTVEEGWTWKIQAENYRKMFREILK